VAIGFPPQTVTLDEIHRIEHAFPEATVFIGVPDGPQPVSPLRAGGVMIYNWPPKDHPMPVESALRDDVY
jgi:hypothetical protein